MLTFRQLRQRLLADEEDRRKVCNTLCLGGMRPTSLQRVQPCLFAGCDQRCMLSGNFMAFGVKLLCGMHTSCVVNHQVRVASHFQFPRPRWNLPRGRPFVLCFLVHLGSPSFGPDVFNRAQHSPDPLLPNKALSRHLSFQLGRGLCRIDYADVPRAVCRRCRSYCHLLVTNRFDIPEHAQVSFLLHSLRGYDVVCLASSLRMRKSCWRPHARRGRCGLAPCQREYTSALVL